MHTSAVTSLQKPNFKYANTDSNFVFDMSLKFAFQKDHQRRGVATFA